MNYLYHLLANEIEFTDLGLNGNMLWKNLTNGDASDANSYVNGSDVWSDANVWFVSIKKLEDWKLAILALSV